MTTKTPEEVALEVKRRLTETPGQRDRRECTEWLEQNPGQAAHFRFASPSQQPVVGSKIVVTVITSHGPREFHLEEP